MPPKVLLLSRIVLVILDFCFFIWRRIVLSRSWRIVLGFCWGLHWIYWLLLIGLPFLLFILPIQEHGRSFCFQISSIFIFRHLKFLSYTFFTSLVSVTLRYFMLFVAIIKDNVSLISFSVLLSFVHRRATYFLSWSCILQH